ncbi:MAG: hypothetical protein H0V54_04970 [Chthoniobacterales bacterium]|nr:hypothetical protein [Chthoniobacterales bacterium]
MNSERLTWFGRLTLHLPPRRPRTPPPLRRIRRRSSPPPAATPPVEGGHADIGGLKIAYAAFKKAQAAHPEEANKKIDGYKSDQRFFLAWAQVWRTN